MMAQGTILIVDDNPANLGILFESLETAKFKVLVAVDGQSALEVIEYARPDLILLDILMPGGMDGFEVCRRLKANDTTRDIPIILMTALNDTVDEVKGLELGAVDFIRKPFQVETVLARIQTHLTLRNMQQHFRKKNAQLQQEISERRRVEEKIRTLNAELEHRVQQRTVKLEAANKELKDFAYVVSHDLKTPLRGISALAYWLAEEYDECFDQHGKEMVDMLITRVKRLDSLIDGLLEYAKVGRVIGEHKPINLNIFVKELISMISPPEQVQIILEDELPLITGDKIRIEQVFRNLLENATQFMDKADGRITIRCVDEGSQWRFSITDNGPGIDKKYHKKIFQIFQILTCRDERESTGIGLALVKKIVEFYGGTIWVESTPGAGSTFWFTFPKSNTS